MASEAHDEDDLDLNKDDETSSGDEETPTTEASRDEEGEVRKQSAKETTRVRIWRVVVTLALFATAVSVTAATYALLVKQEDENFRNVVSTKQETVWERIVSEGSNTALLLLTFIPDMHTVSSFNLFL